jgi:hypothetical protein
MERNTLRQVREHQLLEDTKCARRLKIGYGNALRLFVCQLSVALKRGADRGCDVLPSDWVGNYEVVPRIRARFGDLATLYVRKEEPEKADQVIQMHLA